MNYLVLFNHRRFSNGVFANRFGLRFWICLLSPFVIAYISGPSYKVLGGNLNFASVLAVASFFAVGNLVDHYRLGMFKLVIRETLAGEY